MTKEEVMSIIDSLAHSQGFYGRLANSIRKAETDGVDTGSFFKQFKDCKDSVDVVLAIEC